MDPEFSTMNNFLIIRLSSLGDIVHTLPAFSALRNKFPKAKITWLVENKGKEILDCVPGIDRIVDVQKKALRLGTQKFWKEFSRLKRKIKDKDQIALDFQGLVKSGFFASLSGAKMRIGFHRNNLKESLASLFYTDRLEKVSENTSVMSKNLKLLTRVGIQEDKFTFPLLFSNELKESVKAKLKQMGYEEHRKVVIFNVGAAWETKRWFPERWIELIDRITGERKNIFPLLLWGSEVERELAERIMIETNTPMVSDLSLKEVMVLIGEASLVVSGDTFALQVACALSRPVVGVFGPTNPRRNGPFNPRDKVAFHELECSYCYKKKCSSLDCLKKITPEDVASLSLQLL